MNKQGVAIDKEVTRILQETNWQKPLTSHEERYFSRASDAEERSKGSNVDFTGPISQLVL